MADITYRTADVAGLTVFYREAGAADAPALLLLHGYPSASPQFRELIPLLAGRFHVIAPDLPGFGQTDMPPWGDFDYTFDHLADVIDRWTEVLGLDSFALYVFDYGAMLQPQTTIWQYTHGVPDTTRVSPDGYGLDNYYLARPGNDEIQLDLFLDYASNVALYPAWQDYFRTSRPPLLAVWGRNDPFFLPAGAEAFKRDIPDANVRFFDTGHFALETHVEEIATAIGEFLAQ
jgi:pimeloyl-ACP methyl ester carboxylesterase